MFTKFVLDDKKSVVYIRKAALAFAEVIRQRRHRGARVYYCGTITLENGSTLAISEESCYIGSLFIKSDGHVYLDLRIALRDIILDLGPVGVFLRSIGGLVGCNITVPA